MPRNALGRGLGGFIRENDAQPTSVQNAPAGGPATGVASAREIPPTIASATRELDIDLIEPSPYQPRSHFREEALEELARSVRASGIIQPLIVRPVGNRFQLIAGERRWRAAQRAGMARVPVIVREVPNELALELTLVVNIQREDLNAIEQARPFLRLMEELHLTPEAAAVFARTFRDGFLPQVKLLHQPNESGRWLNSVKNLPMGVFDESQFECEFVWHLAYNHWYARHARALRSPPAPLAGDQLKAIANRPHDERLNDSACPDRTCQLLECLFSKVAARLVRTRLDYVDRQFAP